MHKTCPKCGENKPLNDENFYRSKNGRGDYFFRSKCLPCLRAEAASRRRRSIANDPQAMAEKRRAYRSTSDQFKSRHRADTARSKLRSRIESEGEEAVRTSLIARLLKVFRGPQDEIDAAATIADAERRRSDALAAKPWNAPGLTRAEKYRIRYNIDQDFQIKERLRRQINKRRKRDGIGDLMRVALNKGGESSMVFRLLGYNIATLRDHLERQFTNGMDWAAFMRGEIHIDHIVPQSSFSLSDTDQWGKCWCLSNIRPTWARDNLAKSDKVIFLL